MSTYDGTQKANSGCAQNIVVCMFDRDNVVANTVVRDLDEEMRIIDGLDEFWNDHVLPRIPPEPLGTADGIISTLSDFAVVKDDASVCDHAVVTNYSVVYGNAVIFGRAIINKAWVNADIGGDITVGESEWLDENLIL